MAEFRARRARPVRATGVPANRSSNAASSSSSSSTRSGAGTGPPALRPSRLRDGSGGQAVVDRARLLAEVAPEHPGAHQRPQLDGHRAAVLDGEVRDAAPGVDDARGPRSRRSGTRAGRRRSCRSPSGTAGRAAAAVRRRSRRAARRAGGGGQQRGVLAGEADPGTFRHGAVHRPPVVDEALGAELGMRGRAASPPARRSRGRARRGSRLTSPSVFAEHRVGGHASARASGRLPGRRPDRPVRPRQGDDAARPRVARAEVGAGGDALSGHPRHAVHPPCRDRVEPALAGLVERLDAGDTERAPPALQRVRAQLLAERLPLGSPPRVWATPRARAGRYHPASSSGAAPARQLGETSHDRGDAR